MAPNNPSPNAMTPARRFSVRLALATGATVTTLIGAQTFALLDRSVFELAQQTTTTPTDEPDTSTKLLPTQGATGAVQPTLQSNSQSSSAQAAPPKLTIIRNVGTLPTPAPRTKPSTGTRSNTGNNTNAASGSNNANGSNSFAPPAPVISAPSGGSNGGGNSAPQTAPSQPQPSTKSSR